MLQSVTLTTLPPDPVQSCGYDVVRTHNPVYFNIHRPPLWFTTIHWNFDFGLIPYNHHGHYHIIGCYSWLLSTWPSPPYSHFPQHSLRVETAPFMGEYWKCPEQSHLPVRHRWPHHGPIFIYSVSSCLSLHSTPISISYILPTVTRRLPSVVTTTPTEGKSSFTFHFFLSYSLYYLTVVTYLQQVCSSQYSRYHHTDWGYLFTTGYGPRQRLINQPKQNTNIRPYYLSPTTTLGSANLNNLNHTTFYWQ